MKDSIAGNLYIILIILVYFGIFAKLYIRYDDKRKNDMLPLKEVLATVVTKRKRMNTYGARRMVHGVQTTYYATFQFEDGKRQEFTVHEDEYEALVEGDVGHLIFQGTKYIEFYL